MNAVKTHQNKAEEGWIKEEQWDPKRTRAATSSSASGMMNSSTTQGFG
jgi:hypothetical protein